MVLSNDSDLFHVLSKGLVSLVQVALVFLMVFECRDQVDRFVEFLESSVIENFLDRMLPKRDDLGG